MAVIEEEIDRPVASIAGARADEMVATRLGMALAIAGWVALAAMWATGSTTIFGHDQEAVPAAVGFGLFLVGWTVMVAAMMLPSSVPTLRIVDDARSPERNAAPRFMVGFFIAWAVFGAAAYAGDQVLHLAVDSMPWLAARPSLIIGSVAIFAGFAELVGRSAPPRYPAVRAGAGSVAVGSAHALDRIRRCWPLMLFAMAAGMSSLGWMIGLTVLMALEQNPRAQLVLRLAGLFVIGVGVAVTLQPSWVPVFFHLN